MEWVTSKENSQKTYLLNFKNRRNNCIKNKKNNNFIPTISNNEMLIEKWKTLNFNENYKISDLGQIFSKKRQGSKGQFINPSLNKKGYLFCVINKTCFTVHRLVLCTFNNKNINTKQQVNHKDGNKLNNRLSNLEFVTNKENMIHAAKFGLILSQPVEQYDINNNFIKKFISISSAARETNSKQSAISACIHGKYKTHNNYIWKQSN